MRHMLIASSRFGLILAFGAVTALPALAESAGNVVLSVTPRVVRWAAIHKTPDPRHSDPFYHVQVFEKEKGTKPWVYKILAPHLVVTPDALNASRIGTKARTFHYKNVEFGYAYDAWLKGRDNTPVCRTDILNCLNRR